MAERIYSDAYMAEMLRKQAEEQQVAEDAKEDAKATPEAKSSEEESGGKTSLGHKVMLGAGIGAAVAVGGTVAAAHGTHKAVDNLADSAGNYVGALFMGNDPSMRRLPNISVTDKGNDGPQFG